MKSPDWPECLAGIKLGITLNNIINNGTCEEHREELDSLGFNESLRETKKQQGVAEECRACK